MITKHNFKITNEKQLQNPSPNKRFTISILFITLEIPFNSNVKKI